MSSDPYAPTAEPARGSSRAWIFGIVGCFLGLGVGCLIIPVVTIAGLTLLGNSISSKFDTIQTQLCAENPDDPACKR